MNSRNYPPFQDNDSPFFSASQVPYAPLVSSTSQQNPSFFFADGGNCNEPKRRNSLASGGTFSSFDHLEITPPRLPPIPQSDGSSSLSKKRRRKALLGHSEPKIIRKRLFFDDKSDDLDPEMSQIKDFQYEALIRTVVDIIRTAIEEGSPLVDLSGMGLKSLPSEIVELKHLVSLLTYGNISTLVSLLLHGNKFVSVPKRVFEISNITVLTLSNNQIEELPQDILNLVNLTELSISGNKLRYLPCEILKLSNLKKVFMFPNPFLKPPSEDSSREVSLLFSNILNTRNQSQFQDLPLYFCHMYNFGNLEFPPACFSSYSVNIPSLFDLSFRTLHRHGVHFSEVENRLYDQSLLFDRSKCYYPNLNCKSKNLPSLHLNHNEDLDPFVFLRLYLGDSGPTNCCSV
ncbi:hypothetical protein BB560_004603, partial [Smittium megazygosporum]